MKKIVVAVSLVMLSVWIAEVTFGQNPPNPQTTPQNLVVTAPPPTGPVTARVTNVGVTSQVSYCYWVVAVYPIGMSPASAPACTSFSNGTLSVSNYNRVTWSKPPGAVPTGYWVVRTKGNTFPGSGTVAVNATVLANTVFALNDQSNTLNSFSFVNVPYADGVFSINNTTGASPVLSLTINGTVVSQWVPSGGGGLVNATEVNGSSIPISASLVGTNGSAQFVAVPMAPPTSNGNSSLVYSYQGNVSIGDVNSAVEVVVTTAGRAYRIVNFQLQAVGGGECWDLYEC